eukprot:9337587-Alexandrium_andersonii.AAC.1
MSKPTKGGMRRLKRLARYLAKYPRMRQEFRRQAKVKELTTLVDTDWAGCRKTRKSTSGGMIKHGRHMLKAWSTTQTVIATSSGEAEYYGM